MPMPVNVFTEFYSGYLPPVTGGVKQHESPAIVLFPSFLGLEILYSSKSPQLPTVVAVARRLIFFS